MWADWIMGHPSDRLQAGGKSSKACMRLHMYTHECERSPILCLLGHQKADERKYKDNLNELSVVCMNVYFFITSCRVLLTEWEKKRFPLATVKWDKSSVFRILRIAVKNERPRIIAIISKSTEKGMNELLCFFEAVWIDEWRHNVFRKAAVWKWKASWLARLLHAYSHTHTHMYKSLSTGKKKAAGMMSWKKEPKRASKNSLEKERERKSKAGIYPAKEKDSSWESLTGDSSREHRVTLGTKSTASCRMYCGRGPRDGQTDGRTDKQTDRQTDGRRLKV